METNETVTLESVEAFREAIGVLAKAYTDLEAVVEAQGKMLQAQDTAIKALAQLTTSDHIALEYLGSKP